MILTQEQINSRLSSSKNITGPNFVPEVKFEVIHKDGMNHVGNNHSKHLTEDERVTVGVLANVVGKDTAAELMGVSESTARHLKTGQSTILPYGKGSETFGFNQDLREKIAERLDKTKLSISEQAADTLLRSLNLITNDKMENSSAKDLTSIAVSMSNVVRNMSSSSDNNRDKNQAVRVIIQQPKPSNESMFDMIEVSVR